MTFFLKWKNPTLRSYPLPSPMVMKHIRRLKAIIQRQDVREQIDAEIQRFQGKADWIRIRSTSLKFNMETENHGFQVRNLIFQGLIIRFHVNLHRSVGLYHVDLRSCSHFFGSGSHFFDIARKMSKRFKIILRFQCELWVAIKDKTA